MRRVQTLEQGAHSRQWIHSLPGGRPIKLFFAESQVVDFPIGVLAAKELADNLRVAPPERRGKIGAGERPVQLLGQLGPRLEV